MSKVTKYGLRFKKTGEVLGYYTTSNSGLDFCGNESYMLTAGNEEKWLVDTSYMAEYVRQHSTPWHNTERDIPENPYASKTLEVVKVVVETNVEVEKVSIPTMEEFLSLKYKTTNPEHLEHALKELHRYPKTFYLLNEFQDLLDAGLWNE